MNRSAKWLDTILIALADYAKTGDIPPMPVRAMRSDYSSSHQSPDWALADVTARAITHARQPQQQTPEGIKTAKHDGRLNSDDNFKK